MTRKRTVAPSERSASLQHYYKNREKRLAAANRYAADKKQAPFLEYMRFRMTQIKGRAKQKGMAFTLDDKWLEDQPEHCAVTGQLFVVPATGTGLLSPSFDRIDPTKGYTKKNTRIVVNWYNMAKRQFSDADIIPLIKAAAHKF